MVQSMDTPERRTSLTDALATLTTMFMFLRGAAEDRLRGARRHAWAHHKHKREFSKARKEENRDVAHSV